MKWRCLRLQYAKSRAFEFGQRKHTKARLDTHFSFRWLFSPSKLNAGCFVILAALLAALFSLASGASEPGAPAASAAGAAAATSVGCVAVEGERLSSCGALPSSEAGTAAGFGDVSSSNAPAIALLINALARRSVDAASLTACWQWRHANRFFLRSSGVPVKSRAAKPACRGQGP